MLKRSWLAALLLVCVASALAAQTNYILELNPGANLARWRRNISSLF